MKNSQIWTKSLSASRPRRVEYEDLLAHLGPSSGLRLYVSLRVPGPTQLIFCWVQK